MAERLPTDDLARDERFAPLASDREIGVQRWGYANGEVIVSEGEAAGSLYVLEQGAVAVERSAPESDSGSRYLANLMAGPGRLRVFGEMAYFLADRRTASVKSVGYSQVLKVGEEGIPLLFRRFPELAIEICAGLAEKLRETTRDLKRFQDLHALEAEHLLVTPDRVRLFQAGEKVERLYRVVSGSVALRDGKGGNEIVKAMGPRQGLVNLEEYLLGRSARQEGSAAIGSVVQVISARSAPAVLRSFPEQVLEILGRRAP